MQRLLNLIQRFRPLWEFFAVVVATTSLVFGVYQYYLSVKAERVSAASRYASEFVSNAELNTCQAEIRKLSQNWHDFNSATKDTPEGKKLKDDIRVVLNELEVMAYSVNAHSYDETVIKSNFDQLVYMYCKAHLYGQEGEVPSVHWVDYKDLIPLFPHVDEYPQLKKLYNKWFPDGKWKE